MQTKHERRSQAIDGVLLLNKPAGITSNQALQRVKCLLRAKKAGHTGSLDPAATGMLPLCFGEATKVCAFLLDADKTYRVTAKLGQRTDTGDADGSVIEERSIPALHAEEWDGILQSFLGYSMQVPPMYSALKQGGKRLYELARQGEVVEREARPIRTDSIELLEYAGSRLVFRARCSKGTYVRTLVEDIAAKANTVAHTSRLHREAVAGFDDETMLELSVAEALAEQSPDDLIGRLLSPDAALSAMPCIELDHVAAERFQLGQTVSAETAGLAGLTRVYGPAGRGNFLGVGEIADDNHVAPKRVFASP